MQAGTRLVEVWLNRLKRRSVALELTLAAGLLAASAGYLAWEWQGPRPLRDFQSFHTAARIFSIPGQSIYNFDPEIEKRDATKAMPLTLKLMLQPQSVFGVKIMGIEAKVFNPAFIHPYLYPPLLAALLRPMAGLPAAEALWLWLALLLIASMALPFLLQAWIRHIAPALSGDLPLALAALTTVVFVPVIYDNLFWRQINIVVVDLLLVALLFERRRPGLAGTTFALACCIKMSPSVFVLYFCLRRSWTMLAYTTAAAILLFLLTLPLGGLRHWLAFPSAFLHISAGDRMMMGLYPAGLVGNHSLKGFILRLVPGLDSWGNIAALTLAFCAAVFAALRIHKDRSVGRALILMCSLMLLASPMTWIAHFIFLVPAAAFLLLTLPESSHSWRVRLGGLALAALPSWIAVVAGKAGTIFEHPVVIAALGSTGTLALLALFFSAVFVPTEESPSTRGAGAPDARTDATERLLSSS